MKRGYASLLGLLAANVIGCGGGNVVAKAATSNAAPTAATACPASDNPLPDETVLTAAYGTKVARVCVNGPSGELHAAALKAITSKVGEPLAREAIRSDLYAILATQHFADARVWVERGPAGAILVYELIPRPRVASLTISGTKAFGEEALRAKLPVEKGGAWEPGKVTDALSQLEDAYHVRGYLAAGVQLKTVPAAEGAVDVKITVIEGPLHRVAKLSARGNKRLTEAEIVSATELTLTEPYSREKLEAALYRVQAAYFNRGMVQAKVDGERDESSDAVKLTFVVLDEGPIFNFGKITFKNARATGERSEQVDRATPELAKELLTRATVKTGQVFSRKALLAEVERLSKVLGEKNLHGSMSPSVEIDPAKKLVDVVITIDWQ